MPSKSPKLPSGGFMFDDAVAALRARPSLAAEIAVVNGIWAEIELFLGMVLAVILGAEARLGITIYLALQSEGPQKEVIKAAASLKLSPDDA